MYQKELIKGSLKTVLLVLLEEKGEMYGYEITQTVKDRSNESIQITEGALYPALHKLEANALVDTETRVINGRNRKYYRLSSKGLKEAQKAKQGWVQFSESMSNILNTFSHA